MDLMCTPEATVGMMVTWYFIGTLVGGVLAALPDRIGRKKSVLAGMILSTICQTVMLLVPNMTVRSICFFMMGFSNLKNSQSYVWLSECVPFSGRSFAFTIINIADSLTGLVAGIFYLYISRDYFPLYFFITALSYLAIVLGFFMPESPRWLLVSGKPTAGIQAINYIAWLNRSPARVPDDAIFEETVRAQEHVFDSASESTGLSGEDEKIANLQH